ncbi:hypothetical protein HPP92_028907 [Vanilla planifolia]|uniref:Uncharacterized protein n=1 Tax=Vanilla planifolia TaxID=51239 RepID=A0A835P5N3_VANPL|nr:hypothetical protein HPP92_028907 [Vanilla planifolia]KAG0446310.1 hypothetical protein HPP92_028897 [Vanilla planifolia]
MDKGITISVHRSGRSEHWQITDLTDNPHPAALSNGSTSITQYIKRPPVMGPESLYLSHGFAPMWSAMASSSVTQAVVSKTMQGQSSL